MRISTNILTFVVYFIVCQAFTFYIWWIYGDPWELMPRAGLAFGATVAAFLSIAATLFTIGGRK